MAESKKRKTQTYKVPRSVVKPKGENPKWLVPALITFPVVGVLWIVTTYVSRGHFPLDVGNWNLGIGFGFMLIGMGLLTRWR